MRNEFTIMKEANAKDLNEELRTFDRLQHFILTKVTPVTIGVILAEILKSLT